MLLQELFELYRQKRLRGSSENTVRLYQHSINGLAKTLGRKPAVDDLNDSAIENHMYRMVKAGLSPASANKDRSQLLALWRYAAVQKIVDRWPDVPPMREPERIPLGWMPDEIDSIFRSCRRQDGDICGAPASLWWVCLQSVLLDTGERIGAIRRLEKSSLQNQWLLVPAHLRKGGRRDRLYPLQASTIERLERLVKATDGNQLFPWPYSETYLWRAYKRIIADAGLPSDRRCSFHRVRRTVASAVQRSGGDATAALDHASPKTTKKYLDPRIVGGEAVADILARYLADPSLRKKPPRRDSA